MLHCFAPESDHHSESHMCRFFGFPNKKKKLDEYRRWIRLLRLVKVTDLNTYPGSCYESDNESTYCTQSCTLMQIDCHLCYETKLKFTFITKFVQFAYYLGCQVAFLQI